MGEITIRYSETDGYDVIKDGLSSGGGMTFGEMTEQVMSLTLKTVSPERFVSGAPCYRMRSEQEWNHGCGALSADEQGDC
jgi:hypothetical protein